MKVGIDLLQAYPIRHSFIQSFIYICNYAFISLWTLPAYGRDRYPCLALYSFEAIDSVGPPRWIRCWFFKGSWLLQ